MEFEAKLFLKVNMCTLNLLYSRKNVQLLKFKYNFRQAISMIGLKVV